MVLSKLWAKIWEFPKALRIRWKQLNSSDHETICFWLYYNKTCTVHDVLLIWLFQYDEEENPLRKQDKLIINVRWNAIAVTNATK